MITPEKIEITSMPGPDWTISDEDIKNRRMVSRRYRNRRIGDFLKELKLIEGRTYLTVVLPMHRNFWEASAPRIEKAKKTRRNLAEVKELILALLKQRGNLSSSELAYAMGYTKVTSTVAKAIKELLEEGRVVYSEADKLHSRNQKICLVENSCI